MVKPQLLKYDFFRVVIVEVLTFVVLSRHLMRIRAGQLLLLCRVCMYMCGYVC